MATELAADKAWGARTLRRDAWWLEPALIVVVLGAFVLYATFRVFETGPTGLYGIADNGVYHYATPFSNPDLTFLVPGFLAAIPLAGQLLTYPAAVLLPIPAGFRFTCYYYRRSYYRGFAAQPPGCAVQGTTGKGYEGERRLLLFQNLHRYFLYLALIVLVFNWEDAIKSVKIARKRGHPYEPQVLRKP